MSYDAEQADQVRDALRYRWLRKNFTRLGVHTTLHESGLASVARITVYPKLRAPHEPAVDEAVDNAMKESP